jgi:hypothetical protein
MRLKLFFIAGELQSLLDRLRMHRQFKPAQASKAAVGIIVTSSIRELTTSSNTRISTFCTEISQKLPVAV